MKGGRNASFYPSIKGGINVEKFINNQINVFITKNRDYGNSFENSLNKYGEIAYKVRAEDKLNRIESLMRLRTAHVVDEKVEDTVVDLLNYTVMFLCWLQTGAVTKQEFENNIHKVLSEPYELTRLLTSYDLLDKADTRKYINETLAILIGGK